MTNSSMWDSHITLSESSGSSASMSHDKKTHRSKKGPHRPTDSAVRSETEGVNHSRWRRQILEKINTHPGSFEDFLDHLVPGDKRYRRCAKSTAHVFDEPRKTDILEDKTLMFSPLVSGLNQLCIGMPKGTHLHFVDTHEASFISPYSQWIDDRCKRPPGIIALAPGRKVPSTFQASSWDDIFLVVEVKTSVKHDPMSGDSERCIKTRVQLLRTASKLLLAQRSLCCFIIGIYGSTARVFRFDHAAAVASPAFDYRQEPDLLRKFLCRFTQPDVRATVVGIDESCSLVTRADMIRAKRVSANWQESDCEHNRWVRVPPAAAGQPGKYFLTLRVRSLNQRIFSRSTLVQEAILKGDRSGRRYILKQAWRKVGRPDESRFYQRIQEYTKRKKIPLFGIARLVSGVDLGKSKGKSTAWNLHRTKSSAYRESASGDAGERSQMRLVLDTVGQPLWEFECTKVLVEAMRDAIKGHQLAYKAGVLHRDVSDGNVMIATEKPFKGFIDDFDYSCLIDSSADGGTAFSDKDLAEWRARDVAERTGTFAFLAIELLAISQPVTHGIHHDLQSFYWLLIWVVLRHTKHNHPKGIHAWGHLFGSEAEISAKFIKRVWFLDLNKLHFGVENNGPLTHLLQTFTSLVFKSRERYHSETLIPIVHDSVLAAFDEALAMDGWPDSDPALPFHPPAAPPNSFEQAKKAWLNDLKRSRDDDVDDSDAINVRSSKKAKQ